TRTLADAATTAAAGPDAARSMNFFASCFSLPENTENAETNAGPARTVEALAAASAWPIRNQPQRGRRGYFKIRLCDLCDLRLRRCRDEKAKADPFPRKEPACV